MRAALLPTPGDPFMLAYWLRNFETWRDEVDELVVFVNGANAAADGECRRMVEAAGGTYHSTAARAGHDGALLYLLGWTDADHVVLCEDDAYVRHPEEVGRAFQRIEQGETDIVGSPRHEDYASSPLQEWGEYRPGDLTELRHGLWPAFLFVRRSDLLTTDRLFGDRRWDRGSRITGWGEVTQEACDFVGISPAFVHLDTLFGTTFQLRGAGLRTELVHRVRLYDPSAVESWIDADPPWFHVTGLSTLDYVTEGRTDIPDLDEYGGLWTRRVAWWLRITEGPGAEERQEQLYRFASRTGMGWEDLARWDERFAPWITWADRLVLA